MLFSLQFPYTTYRYFLGTFPPIECDSRFLASRRPKLIVQSLKDEKINSAGWYPRVHRKSMFGLQYQMLLQPLIQPSSWFHTHVILSYFFLNMLWTTPITRLLSPATITTSSGCHQTRLAFHAPRRPFKLPFSAQRSDGCNECWNFCPGAFAGAKNGRKANMERPILSNNITHRCFGTCFFMTFHRLGIIIPTDELIFFRGVGIPPTSKGLMILTTYQLV